MGSDRYRFGYLALEARVKPYPASCMRRRCLIVGLFARSAAILVLGAAFFARAGIPEPDLVWYGKVLTQAGGTLVRVTTGTLTWQVESLAGTPIMVLTTTLTNINDQFSFILRVPCESAEPGVAATPGTLVLGLSPANYLRQNVTLDGQRLTLSGAPGQFPVSVTDRGRSQRIDLVLGTVPADSDGDGLSDAWEQQYFSGLSADPNADPDGDGVNNLREYRAGTNPKDRKSLFEVVEINRLPQGIQVIWSSQPDRTYRVRRSSSLLAPTAVYQTVGSGLSATPPLNQFLDTTTTGGLQFFYLIQIEE